MKFFKSCLISLSALASSTLADLNIQTNNVACHIDAISSTPGFIGGIYQFTNTESNYLSDSSFYAEGYKTEGSLVGYASDITDINFVLQGNTQALYNYQIDSSNFAVEYTGYFKGMHYFLFLDFISFHLISFHFI
jgi:hypothetical protein